MAEHVHSTPASARHVIADTSTPSRRRSLLAAAGAVIMGSGITAGATARIADLVPAGPEAERIALCRTHSLVRKAVNSDPDISDDDPRWAAYFAVYDEISDWEPVTLEGLIAKALATKEDGTNPGGDVGSMSVDWAWSVINGLIRLGGRA